MIRFNFLIISGAFSLLFHFFFIQFILNQKKLNDNKEIFVMDLTSYKEFSIPQTPPPIPEVIEKKEIKPKPKPIPKKKIIKDKIVISKPKIEKQEVKKKEVAPPVQPKKKIIKEEALNQPAIPPTISNKKNPTIRNKKLSEFLTIISNEINIIASQSYPKQSIKRREQGTINTIITLDLNGKIVRIIFDKKKPKRLYKATKKIFQNYKFPNPPKIILNEQNLVTIKVPVNFILK